MVTFHRLDDAKTRVMIQIDWEPEGLVEKAGAALGFDDRQVKADAKQFKEFIESRGTETGAWRGDVERPELDGRTPTTAPAPLQRGRAPSSSVLGLLGVEVLGDQAGDLVEHRLVVAGDDDLGALLGAERHDHQRRAGVDRAPPGVARVTGTPALPTASAIRAAGRACSPTREPTVTV